MCKMESDITNALDEPILTATAPAENGGSFRPVPTGHHIRQPSATLSLGDVIVPHAHGPADSDTLLNVSGGGRPRKVGLRKSLQRNSKLVLMLCLLYLVAIGSMVMLVYLTLNNDKGLWLALIALVLSALPAAYYTYTIYQIINYPTRSRRIYIMPHWR
eukprot:comp6412_c0_seq1/m.2215 comp6412_c0_seq1/g.2215  ORF comp6412_c0_seq1/g.2215 comp6412_c0_seq1/m.2215 type:complete len:159 (-) comp6412_c0_seq1:265-741(-)